MAGNVLNSTIVPSSRGLIIEQLGDKVKGDLNSQDSLGMTKIIQPFDIILAYGKDEPDKMSTINGYEELYDMIYSNKPTKLRIITKFNKEY